MPVGIAHHREITDNTTNINRRLDQNVLLPGELGDAIDFVAPVALEAEVVEPRLHFILDNHQHE